MTKHSVFSTEEVKLHNATAEEVLNLLEPGSIDLVMTDPPYIISKDSGFSKGGDGKFNNYSTDYGAWDRDEFSIEDLEGIIGQMKRVLKPGGTALIFFDIWKLSTLWDMLEGQGFEGIDVVEWQKTNPVPINSRHNFLTNAREMALVAHKPGGKPRIEDAREFGVYPYPIHHGKDRFHPTQKSLPLFEELIGVYAPEVGTVLDCFSGSATTGVAALNTGRAYIGCEPDPEYFEKSVERLKQCEKKRPKAAGGLGA
ncbi:Modification methylase DpnIIB [Roseovarius sp. THAF9]|uniref:DNA-methyltransferase n=1 Tax=Roseovarius sp. THAF9 TaxID=2587847 RepID=UPI00126841EB|nr:site-specific DNA-methyltransferase [Roseovarius sp. THAF9]QFT92061.1 Modification methylase DpnIIB [Roseovarius sp. THAF9]